VSRQAQQSGAAETLEGCGLPNGLAFVARLPRVSAWAKKRVVIAMAIACAPPSLIADDTQPPRWMLTYAGARSIDLLKSMRGTTVMGLCDDHP